MIDPRLECIRRGSIVFYFNFNSKDALAVVLPALMNDDLKLGIGDCVREFLAFCRAEEKALHVLSITLGVAQTPHVPVAAQVALEATVVHLLECVLLP